MHALKRRAAFVDFSAHVRDVIIYLKIRNGMRKAKEMLSFGITSNGLDGVLIKSTLAQSLERVLIIRIERANFSVAVMREANDKST